MIIASMGIKVKVSQLWPNCQIYLPGGHGSRNPTCTGISRNLITISSPGPVNDLVLQDRVGRDHAPDDLVAVHPAAGRVASDLRD